MRAVRTLFLMLVIASAGTLAACASSTGGAGDATTFSVPIEIDNNLPNLEGVTAYIVRGTGSGRRLLGPVESGQRKSFNYDARVGSYRLIARRGPGQDSIVSEQFQLESGTPIRWTLAMNQLLKGESR